MYTKDLPSTNKFRRLVEVVKPFPASVERIAAAAKYYRFGRDTVSFLNLFPPHEIFQSRADFINRCEELELLLQEEREAPEEFLRSPQE